MKPYLQNHVLKVHHGNKMLAYTGNHILGNTDRSVCACTICGNSFKLSKDLKHHIFCNMKVVQQQGFRKRTSIPVDLHLFLSVLCQILKSLSNVNQTLTKSS